MRDYTIKDFIDAGFTLTFHVDNLGRYTGMLTGKNLKGVLRPRDLKALKKYKNIYKLLKDDARIIKISGRKDYYLLQMLELHYDDEFAGMYMLEDLETDTNLDSLLEKYDEMKKETNVKHLK